MVSGGGSAAYLFEGGRPAGALHLTRDMLSGDCLTVQLTSLDELVHCTLGGGVEVPHDHAQGIAVAFAHNVIHDIQQRPQLGNLRGDTQLSRLSWLHHTAIEAGDTVAIAHSTVAATSYPFCYCYAYGQDHTRTWRIIAQHDVMDGDTCCMQSPDDMPEVLHKRTQVLELNILCAEPRQHARVLHKGTHELQLCAHGTAEQQWYCGSTP